MRDAQVVDFPMGMVFVTCHASRPSTYSALALAALLRWEAQRSFGLTIDEGRRVGRALQIPLYLSSKNSRI